MDCRAIIPLDTIKYKSKETKCDYELRFLKSPIPKYLIEYGPKRNPFIPWDKRLEIQTISDKHTLILNICQLCIFKNAYERNTRKTRNDSR